MLSLSIIGKCMKRVDNGDLTFPRQRFELLRCNRQVQLLMKIMHGKFLH